MSNTPWHADSESARTPQELKTFPPPSGNAVGACGTLSWQWMERVLSDHLVLSRALLRIVATKGVERIARDNLAELEVAMMEPSPWLDPGATPIAFAMRDKALVQTLIQAAGIQGVEVAADQVLDNWLWAMATMALLSRGDTLPLLKRIAGRRRRLVAALRAGDTVGAIRVAEEENAWRE